MLLGGLARFRGASLRVRHAACGIGGQIVRRTSRRLLIVAVAALTVAGLGTVVGFGTVAASAGVRQAARTDAARLRVPHTRAAWQRDMRRLRTPGRGCFHAAYPSVTWHAAKCKAPPKVPVRFAPTKSATAATSATRPADVGEGDDYVASVPGLISAATGTFTNVSSGISETGQLAATGTSYSNAFSLQLNSNTFATPLCSGLGSGCTGWQQFLYTFGNSSSSGLPAPQIYMQYWLVGATSCPSGAWIYSPGSATNASGCYLDSDQFDVPALTASELASVSLTGSASWGGDDTELLQVGSDMYSFSASDSMLDLAPGWDQTEWGVFGDGSSSAGVPSEAKFSSDATLEAQTSIAVSSGPPTVTCNLGSDGLTAEYNNLNFTDTPAPGAGELPVTASEQTSGTVTSGNKCPSANGTVVAATGLATDALTSDWQAQSDSGSTGSPQPQPTTTADCGNWSGADGTQVVGLGNGEDLWSFGDTYLGPAVARQDFFNNGFIDNSMVVQDGSTFTTITGGSGCASGKPTSATAPITDAGGAPLWPASSIDYGSDVEKFYYVVSGLVQEQPEVAEIPQADLESGDTYSQQVGPLDACIVSNPIMWGAATISSGGYTYIYGSQQYSATSGDTGGNGGELFLARTTGDPSDQSTWQYYLGGSWSSVGADCSDLTSADALGYGSSGGPVEVPTEFSVTSVNGDFWLTDQDPTNGDQPGWAVAHGATTPTGFSNSAAAAVDLFEPTVTQFSGINDDVPGLVHYSVRMLDPTAVSASQFPGVVISYNVNDSDIDVGCIPLTDYDANAYRPRFVDVPIGDLLANPAAAASGSALRRPALPAAGTGTGRSPAAAGGGAVRPSRGTLPPAALSYSPQPPQLAARGKAQLKAVSHAVRPAASGTSWTYDPDAVPSAAWSSSCPSSYSAVDPDITFSQNPDGSVEVSWPNQGPDVWYWFHWQDDTSYPGVWNENELWTQGPNADGFTYATEAGATASTSTTISQVFTLPSTSPTVTQPGDKFSFWVQAFAAGNGKVISPDSSATAVSYTPDSPSEKVSGLTATAGTNAVTLNWTAIPTPVDGQADWYSVRYKTLTGSTWTYTTDYVTSTADMTPLTGGTEYEFEVAVTDLETKLSSDANWSAAVDSTPKT
jgi:hypothetical protein